MSETKEYRLTEKEEQVMRLLWENGPLTVRELLGKYREPAPHFNTVSTFVHILEEKGYLRREKQGARLCFHPTVTGDQYRKSQVKSVISRLFNNSCLGIVSSLVEDKSISVEELKELIAMVENQEKKS